MSEALERLLAVGDLDTTITQLEHRRLSLADKVGLTALEARLAGLAAQTADAEARRSVLVATQKDLEAQIATITERRESVEKRMYAATGTSSRDLQAMSDEVLHLTQRRAEIEELELAAMVEQEPIDAELAALAAQVAPDEADAVRLQSEVTESALEIDAALEVAVAARAAEAAQLPGPLLDRYETMSQRLKGSAVARLVGHQCGGCHLELSSGEVERIQHAGPDEVATCDQCGRILVPG